MPPLGKKQEGVHLVDGDGGAAQKKNCQRDIKEDLGINEPAFNVSVSWETEGLSYPSTPEMDSVSSEGVLNSALRSHACPGEESASCAWR